MNTLSLSFSLSPFKSQYNTCSYPSIIQPISKYNKPYIPIQHAFISQCNAHPYPSITHIHIPIKHNISPVSHTFTSQYNTHAYPSLIFLFSTPPNLVIIVLLIPVLQFFIYRYYNPSYTSTTILLTPVIITILHIPVLQSSIYMYLYYNLSNSCATALYIRVLQSSIKPVLKSSSFQYSSTNLPLPLSLSHSKTEWFWFFFMLNSPKRSSK